MRWSWRILRVDGIGVHVHITFLLLPLWVAVTHFLLRDNWIDAWIGLGFILVLFGIVVLHELGHALTAKRFGIQTRDITLLPIGGVARLERIPDQPKQELVIALAGPAVNVVLALGLLALAVLWQPFAALTGASLVVREVLVGLMWVNVVLAGFNLLPAFPMDGGRVLRALLALRLPYVRATNLAAGLGQTIALVFAALGLGSVIFGRLGLLSNPFLVLIALFVWMGARHEAGVVQMRSALHGISVGQLLITNFHSLSSCDPLGRAVEHVLRGWQQDFPVIDEGRLVGFLTQSALVHGLARGGLGAPVADSMLRQFPTIDPAEPAETALMRLRSGDGETILAAKDGVLAGILTRENVGQYLLIQSALGRQAEPRQRSAPVPEPPAARETV